MSPTAPPHPCAERNCTRLVPRGVARCPEHARQQTAGYRRTYDAGALYGRRWQAERRAFLAEHPLCVDCLAEHRVTPATELDHIVRHEGNLALFWDRTNWAGRCKSHHSQKTAHEVGWGRR